MCGRVTYYPTCRYVLTAAERHRFLPAADTSGERGFDTQQAGISGELAAVIHLLRNAVLEPSQSGALSAVEPVYRLQYVDLTAPSEHLVGLPVLRNQ